MKMKDHNAKKEKLKQKCDKAKHGLILDQKISHFLVLSVRTNHLRKRRREGERRKKEEEKEKESQGMEST